MKAIYSWNTLNPFKFSSCSTNLHQLMMGGFPITFDVDPYHGLRSPTGPAVQFKTLSPGFKYVLLSCGSLRASPLRIWWNASLAWAGCGNNIACFIEGFASSRCFLSISSIGIEVRMVSSFGTSFSSTNTPISSHGIASAKGKTMSSAMMTGMQPKMTASTSLGLHGAQPKGHKQKMALCMSS